MVIRQLKAQQYELLFEQLVQKAGQRPMEASFDVGIKVDNREYILKVQPESKYRMAALQALEVERDPECGHLHALITENVMLSSLLELLIWQGIA